MEVENTDNELQAVPGTSQTANLLAYPLSYSSPAGNSLCGGLSSW